ncbi:hypothetical protein GWI33_014916 [Rhynchophorus ferrugineus]|uniref:Uncharacterized protein n=1 Tax=Rhynchophorus ferrugineus TaxID=354439 RepID=A0A834I6F1_RHYFE|nr:hypothetical protein GWI33_014916 [Rhynchophorus ferrugineus]
MSPPSSKAAHFICFLAVIVISWPEYLNKMNPQESNKQGGNQGDDGQRVKTRRSGILKITVPPTFYVFTVSKRDCQLFMLLMFMVFLNSLFYILSVLFHLLFKL